MAAKTDPSANHCEPDLLKGAFAGMVGGLVGTWVMSEYQRLWSRVNRQEPQSAGGLHDARDWQEKNEDRNANELAAQAVARHTLGRTLTERELETGAPLMHYAFGTALGIVYGLAAERAAWATSGSGVGFGSAVWAGADEGAMPLIGWSRPQQHPLESHLQSFTAHFVYGLGTELVRRGVRAML
jgi:uncharacterized membrane protein YagU involved in acid resistance